MDIWPTYRYGEYVPNIEATLDAALKASRNSGEEVILKFPGSAAIGSLLYGVEKRRLDSHNFRQGWWRISDPRGDGASFLVHYSLDYPLHRGTLIGAPADYTGWWPIDHPKWFDKNPESRMKKDINPKKEANETILRELEFYIDNDKLLYRHSFIPIIKNLTAKKASGKYDSAKAPQAFSYLVEAGAKKYAKEFASPDEWNKIFDKPTRDALARDYAKAFEAAYALGEYDEYIPKKYRNPEDTKALKNKLLR